MTKTITALPVLSILCPTFQPMMNSLTAALGMDCVTEEEVRLQATLGLISRDNTFAVFAKRNDDGMEVRLLEADSTEVDDFDSDHYVTCEEAFLGFFTGSDSDRDHFISVLGDALDSVGGAQADFRLCNYRVTTGHRWSSIFEGEFSMTWDGDFRTADWNAALGLEGRSAGELTLADAREIFSRRPLAKGEWKALNHRVHEERVMLMTFLKSRGRALPDYLNSKLNEFALLREYANLVRRFYQ